jgi:hypothetical protein
MRKTSTLTLLALTGLTAFALTGCSGGGQTVAEACTTAQTALSDVQTDMTEVQTDAAAGDFSKLAGTLDTLEDKLSDTADKLGNAEVKTALNDLSDKVGTFGELFEDIDDGDVTAISDKVQEITDAATAVQESGTKLDALCNG